MTWEESRPSRLRVAQIYIQRAFNSIGNSSPYLSGDLFADNCDLAIGSDGLRRRPFSSRSVKSAKVIYCRSDLLESFFEENFKIITARVVIAGNSDREFHTYPDKVPTSVKHLFLQNSFIPNDARFTAIPIGIENRRWAVNGVKSFMISSIPWDGRSSAIMVGPFGLTHSIRVEIEETFSKLSLSEIAFFPNRLAPKDYAKIAGHYKFVAAVRGNGVDTHRHWESIYRGSKVVVQRDNWSVNFKDLDLPFLFIEGWSVDAVLEALKNDLPPKDPKDIPALWWPYWNERIKSYL
jgi:hypothetical protein